MSESREWTNSSSIKSSYKKKKKMASRITPSDVEEIHGKAAGKRVLEPRGQPGRNNDDGASTSGASIEEDETQGPAADLDDQYTGGMSGDAKGLKQLQHADSNALRARAFMPSTSNCVPEQLIPDDERTQLEQEIFDAIMAVDHIYECPGQEDNSLRRLVPDDENMFLDPLALSTNIDEDECDHEHEDECYRYHESRRSVFAAEWDPYDPEKQPCAVPRIYKRNRVVTIPNYIIELKSALTLDTQIVGGRRVVLVFFKAERNDGVEVVVDNLYMRMNRPALLIDFYEHNVNAEGFNQLGPPGFAEQPSIQETQNAIAPLPGGSGNQDSLRPSTSASSVPKITKLIAAVGCTPIVTSDGRQDVLIKFQARTSDGQETVVDNVFMRENYPFLLIDFYEAKLQYAPAKPTFE